MGVFGPILSTVIVDAAQSELAWGHWDQGAGGSQAVFRYAVPKEKSNFLGKLLLHSGRKRGGADESFSPNRRLSRGDFSRSGGRDDPSLNRGSRAEANRSDCRSRQQDRK